MNKIQTYLSDTDGVKIAMLMKKENKKIEPIVDYGQFDNIDMLCGYCLSVRKKEIICKGGNHSMEHFGWYYRNIGHHFVVPKMKLRIFIYGIMYKFGLKK